MRQILMGIAMGTAMHQRYNKKVVVHRGGTIKKGRLMNVARCRVAGSDVSVARAANLH